MLKLKTLIFEDENPRLGECYVLSAKYVQIHPKSILVHGKLINPFNKGNYKKLDHAWVEIGDQIFDPVMDHTYPKPVYENLFKVKIYKKYSQKEVFDMILKRKTWGPWS